MERLFISCYLTQEYRLEGILVAQAHDLGGYFHAGMEEGEGNNISHEIPRGSD